MRPSSDRNSKRWSRRYSAALRSQLALDGKRSLLPARTLGREAVAADLDSLDVARTHARTLRALPKPSAALMGGRNGTERFVTSFLVEAIAPIAKAHHAAMRRELGRGSTSRAALGESKRHYATLLKSSQRMQEQLRRLSHEILYAHEEERKKISRELHDEIGQALSAINVRLATLKLEAAANTTGLKHKITSTQRLVERSMQTVHRFALELRPTVLDDLGLVPALRAYLNGFAKRSRLPVRFSTAAVRYPLDGDARTALYRVAQEALANVSKHAQASLVTVTLRRMRGELRMEVHDNGRSFDVERVFSVRRRIRRLGFLGMRERLEMVGGTFAVKSAPDHGTTIVAQVPLGDRSKQSPPA